LDGIARQQRQAMPTENIKKRKTQKCKYLKNAVAA
jgi:hypothetical protein